MPRVEEWLEYAQPDVLCLQETKLADDAFPPLAFSALGYDSVHHGHNQWNGVAILSRVGIDDVTTGFDSETVDPYEGDARRDRRHVRRRPRRVRLRAERSRGRHRVLRPQAGVVRRAPRLAGGHAGTRPAGGGARRLQRRARGSRRVVAQGVQGLDARHRAGTRARSTSSASGASSTRSARSTTPTTSSPTGTTGAATSTSTAACASTSRS